MTEATPSAKQEERFQEWWMSDAVPPDVKYNDESGGLEDQCRAAFAKGWQNRDHHLVPLMEALEKIRKRAEDERYGIQAQRLSDIATMAHDALEEAAP